MNTGRSSQGKALCLSVCLFVCLSVKRMLCDKTEERSVQIFIPYKRSLSLVFCGGTVGVGVAFRLEWRLSWSDDSDCGSLAK